METIVQLRSRAKADMLMLDIEKSLIRERLDSEIKARREALAWVGIVKLEGIWSLTELKRPKNPVTHDFDIAPAALDYRARILDCEIRTDREDVPAGAYRIMLMWHTGCPLVVGEPGAKTDHEAELAMGGEPHTHAWMSVCVAVARPSVREVKAWYKNFCRAYNLSAVSTR